MYIALYDENRRHMDNINHVTYDLTTRVYDPDSFSAEGICESDVNAACIAVVNDDHGNYRYACFADTVKPESQKRKVKGLDFKTLWDTEILLDFTAENSFDGKLSAIFQAVKNAVFEGSDATVKKIPVTVEIPTDLTDTTEVYGSYQGTYKIVNAYAFLKCYLKYYEYNIETRYDVPSGTIVFAFVKCARALSVNLNDFIYELTTSSATVNKAVATLQYHVETPETDARGEIIYTDVQATDENGDPKVDADGNPVYIPKYKPRPQTIATRYYYRDQDNHIIQGNAAGKHLNGAQIAGRIYPVYGKYFESEYLADAQFDAVYELANARYVDNIVIDNNASIDPIDFSKYPLYTKVSLYYGGRLYKTLPISEKIFTCKASGESIKIKLGFKKILLTEIIKK